MVMIKINNKKDIKHYIKKFEIDKIFKNDMTNYMELYSCTKGDHIYMSNRDIEHLYFLVKGTVKIYTISKNGKALSLRFYNPLQILGDIEFIGNKLPTCNVQCLDDSLFIVISFDDMRRYANDDINFYKYISKIFSDKLSTSSDSNMRNFSYSLEERLASYILALSYDSENSNQNSDEVEIFKLNDIAELLGTSYRHLIRTINSLMDKKIIYRKRNIIKILDRDRLEKLAKDLYD